MKEIIFEVRSEETGETIRMFTNRLEAIDYKNATGGFVHISEGHDPVGCQKYFCGPCSKYEFLATNE